MMIKRFIREWEYLRIAKEDSGDAEAVARAQADRLLSVARIASDHIGLGGEDAGRVLADGRN